MSKAREFMDRKFKAIHSLRRYETAHKKYIRRKKILNNEYGGYYESRGWRGYYFYGGKCYYEYDGIEYCDFPYDEEKIINELNRRIYVDYWGNRCKILGIREKYVKRINHGKSTKEHRRYTSRKIRGLKITDDSSVMKGCKYKRSVYTPWD